MDINEKLQMAGITGNESKAYLELIKKGDLTANQIAKNIGMDRTLVYTVLNHLIEKGHASYVIKNGKKIFAHSPVENLLNNLKKKEIIVNELVSDLKKIKKQENYERTVEIYEGKDGLRAVLGLILRYKEFCSFGANGRAYEHLVYEAKALEKDWTGSGGSARIITHTKYKNHEMTKVKNIQTRFLDIKGEVTTSVYGDYVSIHQSIAKPTVILIKDKYVAESYRNHFEALWKIAKVN